jgi:type VI secretion system protein ImpH
MAPAGGTEDTPVIPLVTQPEDASGEQRAPVDLEQWPIVEMLDREPYRFEFFQAVRLLTRMATERQVVGRFSVPSSEVARFGAHSSVAFPASEIQELERPVNGPAKMRVNFMGLTGPLGVLPLMYSEMVINRLRARDRTMRDFFDLFNHRIISLFYQAWEKYRFVIPYERGELDPFSHHVLALLGLGTPGMQDRQDVSDDSLLFYSGLLSLHTRSATALRQLLSDYFDVPLVSDRQRSAVLDDGVHGLLGEAGLRSHRGR